MVRMMEKTEKEEGEEKNGQGERLREIANEKVTRKAGSEENKGEEKRR